MVSVVLWYLPMMIDAFPQTSTTLYYHWMPDAAQWVSFWFVVAVCPVIFIVSLLAGLTFAILSVLKQECPKWFVGVGCVLNCAWSLFILPTFIQWVNMWI